VVDGVCVVVGAVVFVVVESPHAVSVAASVASKRSSTTSRSVFVLSRPITNLRLLDNGVAIAGRWAAGASASALLSSSAGLADHEQPPVGSSEQRWRWSALMAATLGIAMADRIGRCEGLTRRQSVDKDHQHLDSARAFPVSNERSTASDWRWATPWLLSVASSERVRAAGCPTHAPARRAGAGRLMPVS
jgi:hypothetical protein